MTMIGDAIDAHIKARGLKQKAVAERAGISPVTLNRIVKGHQTPDTTTLQAIAKSLDCSIDDLAKPQIVKASGAAVLKILDDSGLVQALDITDEERSWLLELPSTTWLNKAPEASVIAQFLLARRSLSGV